ncbi:MAG: 3D domain-containing protein [Lachnospiraceae bacterium]|nr:3D domain-containing protein [Lachnospiraceae bacterium]
MKISFSDAKEKIIETTKEFSSKYYQVVSASIVIAALAILSVATLAGRINESHQSVGVIMSLSDVSSGKEAFAGETFEAKGITYIDMVNVNYETEELAQLEKTEKQVDDILAAKSQAKKDQAALEALTAEHASAADFNTYEGEPEEQQTAVFALSPTVGLTEITFADENGSYQYLGEFTLTGYCPCAICCGKWSNPSNPITASGTTPAAGRTVAADTSRYPFGTKLMINGQIYTVEDVGGAIKGNHIDIYFNTHEEARAFGKQYGSVYFVQ